MGPTPSLVNGSVATTQGVVAEGNGAGDVNIIVNMGDITPNSAVTIRFRAQIKNPLPSGVSQVVNQGVVTGANFPSVATDDPNTPTPGDPVVTLLFAAPRLAATKTDLLVVDADGNNAPSPGDTLEYRILLVNTGNQAATGVIFDDAPDPNTQLLAGSVATSQGTVLIGNNGGDRAVRIEVGTVPAHGGAVIDNPLPPTVTLLANQGIFSGDNFPLTLTDDPDTLAQSDRIDTPATLDPRLRAYKRDFLLIDFTNPNSPGSGASQTVSDDPDTAAELDPTTTPLLVPLLQAIFRPIPPAKRGLRVEEDVVYTAPQQKMRRLAMRNHCQAANPPN
jgi:uncharacterized repeat protein (TIGR01451 family)